MQTVAHTLSRWSPLVLYIGLIFYLSSRPFPAAARVAPDVILHGVEYFLLGTFMIRALNDGFRYLVTRRIVWLSVLLCWGCAALDEWFWQRISDRVPSLGDFLSDATGAVLAVVAVMTIQRLFTRPVRPESG